MTTEKKKKKVQQQEQHSELIGSADYIASHEIDQIIKKGRDRIKHAITVSDVKLTKTKKQIIKEMAIEMEQAGYPVNQICDRLTKSLKGLVSERTVRELDSKYKNPEQSEVAKMQQNHDGGSHYRQQEQLKNKDIKEFTEQDIKVANPTQLRKVAKHQMKRADWWEQQAKQNQAPASTTKQDDDAVITTVKNTLEGDLNAENDALKKKNEQLEKFVDDFAKIWQDALDPKWTDEEIGRQVREIVRKAAKIMKRQGKNTRV